MARLLDFDRSSVKRTTVIDDQADYFAHSAGDAWLTQVCILDRSMYTRDCVVIAL